MESILTLDIASSTGWASWRDGSPVRYGSIVLPDYGDSNGLLFATYRTRMLKVFLDTNPGRIVRETPLLLPRDKREKLLKVYGLVAITDWMAYDHGIFIETADVGKIRKHFIGRGDLKTEVAKPMVMAACEALGWSPENFDESDSLAILDYTCHKLKIDVPWSCGGLFAAGAAA